MKRLFARYRFYLGGFAILAAYVVVAIEHPEQARALGVEPPTWALLYGPPETGKTTVAKVLAAQAHCSFYP